MRLFWKIRFILNGYNHRLLGMGGGGGGKSSPPPPPPPPPDPVAQANAIVEAQIAARPRAAQAEFNILTNPEFGLRPQTEFEKSVREDVFSGEAAIKNQLLENALTQLQSPTGLTTEQQAALDERRGIAQQDFTEALRNRANLGGGLFGGRSARTEQRAIGELQNQFVEEDIARQERERLNAQQLALAISQVLFPGQSLVAPQFVDPVQGANTLASTISNQNISHANNVTQQRIAEEQRNAALQGSLFGALGTATGGLFSNRSLFK